MLPPFRPRNRVERQLFADGVEGLAPPRRPRRPRRGAGGKQRGVPLLKLGDVLEARDRSTRGLPEPGPPPSQRPAPAPQLHPTSDASTSYDVFADALVAASGARVVAVDGRARRRVVPPEILAGMPSFATREGVIITDADDVMLAHLSVYAARGPPHLPDALARAGEMRRPKVAVTLPAKVGLFPGWTSAGVIASCYEARSGAAMARVGREPVAARDIGHTSPVAPASARPSTEGALPCVPALVPQPPTRERVGHRGGARALAAQLAPDVMSLFNEKCATDRALAVRIRDAAADSSAAPRVERVVLARRQRRERDAERLSRRAGVVLAPAGRSPEAAAALAAEAAAAKLSAPRYEERRETARHNREEAERVRREVLVAMIAHKTERAIAGEAMRARWRQQRAWLGVIQLIIYGERLTRRAASHVAGIRSFVLRRCARVIARAWVRVRARWLWAKLSGPSRAWRRAICCVRYLLRGRKFGFGRRANAAFTLRLFLSEHKKSRDLTGYVRLYLWRVRKAQRLIRAWRAATGGRRKLLAAAFDRLDLMRLASEVDKARTHREALAGRRRSTTDSTHERGHAPRPPTLAARLADGQTAFAASEVSRALASREFVGLRSSHLPIRVDPAYVCASRRAAPRHDGTVFAYVCVCTCLHIFLFVRAHGRYKNALISALVDKRRHDHVRWRARELALLREGRGDRGAPRVPPPVGRMSLEDARVVMRAARQQEVCGRGTRARAAAPAVRHACAGVFPWLNLVPHVQARDYIERKWFAPLYERKVVMPFLLLRTVPPVREPTIA